MHLRKLPMIPIVLIFLYVVSLTDACNPGQGRTPPGRGPPVSTPLKLKQRVPDVSERTIGASGKAYARIERGSDIFNELLSANTNSDIVFKDEEGTGADRLMTQRCKDKLNALAISVMNFWPGIKLRVIEAWEEDGLLEEDSLHYEGRAVDITTDDRDKAKYGQLARMAVDAGFDWVMYESRNYVHCSVKTDADAKNGAGCFNFESTVTLRSGEIKTLEDIKVGDEVAVVENDGTIGYSKIIMLMDRRLADTLFYSVQTDFQDITLTPEHLIYIANTNASFSESRAVFASEVKVGQYVYVNSDPNGFSTDEVYPVRVKRVLTEWHKGAVAPLTFQGAIVVNGVAASSYAVIKDEWIAHMAFAPVRWYNSFTDLYYDTQEETIDSAETSLHWYPTFLYKYGGFIVSQRLHSDFTLPE